MRKSRLITAAAAALIPMLALAGCGSDSNKADDTGEQTVTFWYSNTGPAVDAINQLVGEFNDANKGKITVKASCQGSYADVQQKFSAAVQSKSTPSILQMNDTSTGFMIDSKQTTPVWKFANDDKDFDQEAIPEIARKYYSDSNGLLSMPMSVSEPVMYINKQLATQAGLDLNNLPETFDDVVEWATAIHEKTGNYGYSQVMVDSWILEQLSANAGVEICDPDNGRGDKPVTGITMTTDEQLEVFDKIAGMFRDGVGLNPGNDNDNMVSGFSSGKVGLVLTSSASYTNMWPGGSVDNVAIAKFPKVNDSADAGTPIGGNSLWIVAAEHSEAEQKASYEFAKFMMTPHAQAVFSKASGNLFANSKAADEPEGKEALADPNVKVFYEQLEANPMSNASLGCRTGAFPSIRKDVINAFSEAINGKDLKEAMKAGEEKAAKDIATYNKAAAR